MHFLKETRTWLQTVVRASDFHVQPIRLADSEAWRFTDGSFRHVSGRFFKVVGTEWESPEGICSMRPLIDQWEKGILAFVIRERDNHIEILVQAKAEPGNVGIAQLAPTYQATQSNTERVHGGDAPPLTELFSSLTQQAAYDVLQSEQGTRFFGKHNRNVFIRTDRAVPLSDTHRWLRVDQFLPLLWEDFLVNTDARSVLVCSPWELLVGRKPFSHHQSGFGEELAQSTLSVPDLNALQTMKTSLRTKRASAAPTHLVPLDRLAGWALTDEGIHPVLHGPFRVRQIRVHVLGREVSTWDQPIIDSCEEGTVVLVCGRKSGVLHFLFRFSYEPGLSHRGELTPTFVTEPGVHPEQGSTASAGMIRAECRQSEEGGRFYQDVNLYRIWDVGTTYEVPAGSYWLTLREIRMLLDEPGWFTNESRSVLSLLLPWM